MKKMIFVGIVGGSLDREVFKHNAVPTELSHGHRYVAVVGDFRTMRGAKWFQRYGKGNPHCRCVTDAEYWARLEQVNGL